MRRLRAGVLLLVTMSATPGAAPPPSPRVLASDLDVQGKYAQAQPLLERALAIRLKVLGEDHPDTARSYHDLARNLEDQGKYNKAQPLLERALAIRRKLLGDDHPDTASAQNSLAFVLWKQGKKEQAVFRRQRLDLLKPYVQARGGLPAVRRLMVDSTGAMALVPVEVLDDDHVVSYVLSGSTFVRLAEKHRPLKVSSLLAVGDPACDASVGPLQPASVRSALDGGAKCGTVPLGGR